jgi:catechol 2,3-dioxygenase-like lactoylglutathione lyase family enzyme
MRGARLAASLAVVALVLAAGPAPAARAGGLVHAVGSIGMTVGDMERSIAFYARVLDFEKVSDVELVGDDWDRLQGVFGLRMRVVRLRLGLETLELTEFRTPRGRPVPPDSRSNDRWFQHVAIVVGDLDRAWQRLRDHRVEPISPAPQRLPDWNPSAGGIRAFYFKDPDGHPLEILWFPPGKGPARWHEASSRLFLGIDHTAIVVGDTEASLACYRDVLGLRVAGTSDNHGPEQERLNSVFAAHLRITTLRAAGGPGVELLEYLTPRDGRPAPVDARTNDLSHWESTLLVGDADAVARATRGSACGMLSPSLGLPAEPALGFARALRLRDPDGHALRVAQP